METHAQAFTRVRRIAVTVVALLSVVLWAEPRLAHALSPAVLRVALALWTAAGLMAIIAFLAELDLARATKKRAAKPEEHQRFGLPLH